MVSQLTMVVSAVALVDVNASKCCYDDGLTVDQCPTAADCDGDADYCSSSSGNCSDCGGVFCADEPAPTPAPSPPVPSPAPTPPSGESKCCYDDGLTPDQCATAADCDGASDYCSASSGNCGDCGGVFCAADPAPAPTPTPAPTPVPTPPSGESKCCYDDGLTPDQCSTAADCDGASDYCSSSSGNCSDCGGVFCAAGPAPAPTPAPVPTPAPTPPSGEAKCCYDDGLTPDQCSTAADCDGASDYCSSSSGNCSDCGGVFCAATGAILV